MRCEAPGTYRGIPIRTQVCPFLRIECYSQELSICQALKALLERLRNWGHGGSGNIDELTEVFLCVVLFVFVDMF